MLRQMKTYHQYSFRVLIKKVFKPIIFFYINESIILSIVKNSYFALLGTLYFFIIIHLKKIVIDYKLKKWKNLMEDIFLNVRNASIQTK